MGGFGACLRGSEGEQAYTLTHACAPPGGESLRYRCPCQLQQPAPPTPAAASWLQSALSAWPGEWDVGRSAVHGEPLQTRTWRLRCSGLGSCSPCGQPLHKHTQPCRSCSISRTARPSHPHPRPHPHFFTTAPSHTPTTHLRIQLCPLRPQRAQLRLRRLQVSFCLHQLKLARFQLLGRAYCPQPWRRCCVLQGLFPMLLLLHMLARLCCCCCCCLPLRFPQLSGRLLPPRLCNCAGK